MLNRIFDVSIKKAGGSERNVKLQMPAMPYQMQDALEQLRAGSSTEVQTEIRYCHSSTVLNMVPTAPGGLYEVNELAQQLAGLEDWQQEAFDGLLKMEATKSKNPIPVPKLIDLAYSTECCHVVDGVTTDPELGKFYVDNELWGGSENLSEEALAKLDYAAIGREARLDAGGVFTANSYIEQHSDLIEASRTLDFKPETPDYTILLEGVNGGALLKLPMTETELSNTLGYIGAEESAFKCVDCKAPTLIGAARTADGIHEVNQLASALAEMLPKQLTEYKAILTATKCSEFDDAIQHLGTMEDYIVTREYETMEDVALDEMSVIMSPDSVEIMLPYLDLEGYGRALVSGLNADLTAYGMVERKDRQPVYTPQEQPQQGGMEMT